MLALLSELCTFWQGGGTYYHIFVQLQKKLIIWFKSVFTKMVLVCYVEFNYQENILRQSCQVQKMKNLEVITAISPYLPPVCEMARVNNADNQMVSQSDACDSKKMSLRAQNMNDLTGIFH